MWRALHNEFPEYWPSAQASGYVYVTPNIVRVIISRKLRWAGHVGRMEEDRSAFKISTGKGKRPNMKNIRRKGICIMNYEISMGKFTMCMHWSVKQLKCHEHLVSRNNSFQILFYYLPTDCNMS